MTHVLFCYITYTEYMLYNITWHMLYNMTDVIYITQDMSNNITYVI